MCYIIVVSFAAALYNLVAGVMCSFAAGDLGGPEAAATACSLIDFAGYCGSIVLMLVGNTESGFFHSTERPYFLLFVVFGLMTTAASVALSVGLIVVKRGQLLREQGQPECREVRYGDSTS
jgi:hypothetical protein